MALEKLESYLFGKGDEFGRKIAAEGILSHLSSSPTPVGVSEAVLDVVTQAADEARAERDRANELLSTDEMAERAILSAIAIDGLKSENDALKVQLAEARKALDALDRMSRGVDWCDQDEQARRWSAARRALEGGTND